MSNNALSEEWIILSTIEVQAKVIREETFPFHVLQGLNLTADITARITVDLNNDLTNLCNKTPLVFVRILCRCKEKGSTGGNGIQGNNHYNHSPPAAWNYFIIERKGEQVATPVIELYLFPDR